MSKLYSDQDKNLPEWVLRELNDIHDTIESMSNIIREDTIESILYPIEDLLTANGFSFKEQDF